MFFTYPKLIVLDVDGVLTNGKKSYQKGKPVGKEFNDRDFTAIKLLQTLGISVCFMTADKSNLEVARDRNISYFSSRDEKNRINKVETFFHILEEYGVAARDVWGVGDDLFDRDWLWECGQPFIPQDATEILSGCFRLRTKGGDGVVMELAETLVQARGITAQNMEDLIERDSHEGWSSTSREST